MDILMGTIIACVVLVFKFTFKFLRFTGLYTFVIAYYALGKIEKGLNLHYGETLDWIVVISLGLLALVSAGFIFVHNIKKLAK